MLFLFLYIMHFCGTSSLSQGSLQFPVLPPVDGLFHLQDFNFLIGFGVITGRYVGSGRRLGRKKGTPKRSETAWLVFFSYSNGERRQNN